jgi:hypothetical protein
MKHMILGFLVLILIPLVSRWRSHPVGRGLAVVLLAAASKLGAEGIQLGPIAKQVQCARHDTLPWLISFLLGLLSA